jgi:four helix bundle protein
VLEIYRATRSFPHEERFGLVSQLRRSAVSVPTNIAEGSKRASSRDYARLLNIAEGSVAELEYLLMLSHDLDLIEEAQAAAMLKEADEIARMLNALRVKVEAGHTKIRNSRL